MKQAWTVFSYELRRNFARKGYLFTTFGIPLVVFALMLGYNALTTLSESDEASEAEIDFGAIEIAGFVDLSGAFADFDAEANPKLRAYPDEAAAQQALSEGAIDVYYVFPPDYLQTGAVTAYLPTMSVGKLSGVNGPVEQLVYSTLGREVAPQEILRLRLPPTIEEFNLERTDAAAQNEDADFLIVYAFIILFFIVVLTSNGYLMQSVIEEKETRLIEILVSSIRPTQLLLGKVLAMSLLSLLQLAVWVFAIIALVRVSVQLPAFAESVLASVRLPLDTLPFIIIYFLLGYLLMAGAFSAVGALSNSMREGPQYLAIFMIPFFVPYYFAPIFVVAPNEGLAQFLSIFPLTSPISMTIRLTIGPVPLGELALSICLLALLALGVIWLSGRLFRFQTLLSGQVPKLRDLPYLLRG